MQIETHRSLGESHDRGLAISAKKGRKRMQTDSRIVYRFLGLLVAGWAWQTASAFDVSWTSQPGSAVAITSHVSGLVWTLGTDGPGLYAYNVYKWNGKEFVRQSLMPGRRIAVTSKDQLWLVNSKNELNVQDGRR